ncbi:hypothetical protein Pelo_9632 [Pelomyxa schiedti]|nr:hypothetical protein Pelo_9632 [Pelomyxa schiedti]
MDWHLVLCGPQREFAPLAVCDNEASSHKSKAVGRGGTTKQCRGSVSSNYEAPAIARKMKLRRKTRSKKAPHTPKPVSIVDKLMAMMGDAFQPPDRTKEEQEEDSGEMDEELLRNTAINSLTHGPAPTAKQIKEKMEEIQALSIATVEQCKFYRNLDVILKSMGR